MQPYRCGLPVAMTIIAAGATAMTVGTVAMLVLAAKTLIAPRH